MDKVTKIFDQASQFASQYIEPVADKLDKEKAFPEEVFDKLHQEKYLELLIPKELGGQGGDIVDHTEVIRAFSAKSATVGLTYMMHNVALNAVVQSGEEATKQKIIKEVIEDGKFLALAYSEPTGGVEFYKPDTTQAVKDGNKWTINGSKSMVTSATFADYYIVIAKTIESEEDAENFLVAKDADGVNFKMELWNGLGMRGNVSCPMDLKDVVVSDQDRLEDPDIVPLFLAGLAAVYSGLNMAIAQEAISHAMDRQYPDGHKLSEVDTIKSHISKIYSNAVSAAAVTKDAVYDGREDLEAAIPKILAARLVATENVNESANLGMRIGGGRAYTGYKNFELYLRDALAGQVMAPSLDMLYQWIGAALTDQDMIQ
ncbi:acyl-CoA dehydrogenase family protein [Alloiococcus otitis]|uniref:acyl-CoA dehydrogenase family protein n=1 Tax=Alloiococcus otitis TaxID=1652 RepID=UPI00059006C8